MKIKVIINKDGTGTAKLSDIVEALNKIEDGELRELHANALLDKFVIGYPKRNLKAGNVDLFILNLYER